MLHDVQQPGQRPSRYASPTSVADAIELLERHGDAARLIAGGTDLLVELDRGARPGTEVLVDLGRIPGLDSIEVDGGTIRLGALVTHNQVVASSVCQTDATPLAQACWEVGSPQLRNRATVVGNVVTASPANDSISALVALGASIELTSAAGVRSMPLTDFFTGFRETALADHELVTALVVPRLMHHQRGVYVKLGLRRAQAISVVHLAAVVGFDADGIVTDARVALGSVAATVVAPQAITAALVGKPLNDEAIDAAAAAATAAVEPIDDLRSTADYRSDLLATMTRRALRSLARGDGLQTWPADPPLLWGRDFDGRFPTGDGHRIDVGADEPITTTVNGREVVAADATGGTLLDWLRDHAAARGVKEGCAEGECGACTVHLDGAAVMSCLVPAGRANGADIVTVEGLADDQRLHPIQEAFVACNAVQCGYCTPGFLMASSKLLEEHTDPTRAQVTNGLSGNLCRCTGYNAIHAAVERAAEITAGGAT